MRSLRPLLLMFASMPMLWMLVSCGKVSNAPPPCSGQYECAIDEQCYNNMCVRVLNPQPPDSGNPPPPTCQISQCSSNGQCFQASDQTCGFNGSPCIDCSASSGCNYDTGQCNGGQPPPPPTCQAGQCSSNNQCFQASNQTCGVNGSPCIDCSASNGCNFGTGQCNGGQPPPPSCQAGQCALNNQCFQVSNQTCGVNGSPCIDCSASNGCNFGTGQCNGGQPPPGCQPGKCVGCCQNNVCIPASNNACGVNGSQCVDCSANGGCDFTGGRCLGGNPPTCGPGTCAGCCQNGQCVQPTSIGDFACGAQGNQCDNCQAKGSTCNRAIGQCGGGNPTCGPSTCAGCCQNGQCVQPTSISDFACGAQGNQCDNCQGKGSTCNRAIGQCQNAQPTCGASNCPTGCCQNGQCIQSVSDVACGNNGQACVSCSAQGQTCNLTSKQCQNAQPTCGPSNCAAGCCQNGQCITSINDRACGSNGSTCQNCASTQECDLAQKTCTQKQQSQYPSGPYGSSVGGVMDPNITFTECANSSNGAEPTSTKSVFASQKKVVLLTVHAGW